MKKVFLSLITVFMVLSLSVVLAKAEGETSVALTDGVQIRTDGNNGLQWVANVTNHKDSNEYGFLFAQGEVKDLTVETAGVELSPKRTITVAILFVVISVIAIQIAATARIIFIAGVNFIISHSILQNLFYYRMILRKSQ